MKEHSLKVWTEYWDALASGEKNFEVRRDDRGFQKGDVLVLNAWDRHWNEGKGRPAYDAYGNRREPIRRKITFVLTGGQFGIEPGFVVLGLKKA